MITTKIDLELNEEQTLYKNVKKTYLFGIRIFKKHINSNLPIDITNCFPENQQPKIGFNKK